MYFWVNQGKTYKEEKEGGYLWAPIRNKKGERVFHWENMTKLKPNDIVFNYRKGFIVGYSIVESTYYLAPQPEEFNVDVVWGKNGYMVDARYFMLNNQIDSKTLHEKIANFLPEKYSPLNKVGLTVKANQGYLYEISDKAANAIIELARINYLQIPDDSGLVSESSEIYQVPDQTSRRGLVISRVGQGAYRRRVLERWNYKCAVSKSSTKEILIASHIVPWREATNEERLDVHNGLLLSPTYDALFDRYLISFDDDGKIMLSKSIRKEEFLILGVNGKERIDNLTERNMYYLKRHRDKLVKI
ncbi:MAG: HNH endonuclease [Saprospiraceae bacterium]|nr:HNH endonuclease [Saprospiraceae bacterium]